MPETNPVYESTVKQKNNIILYAIPKNGFKFNPELGPGAKIPCSLEKPGQIKF